MKWLSRNTQESQTLRSSVITTKWGAGQRVSKEVTTPYGVKSLKSQGSAIKVSTMENKILFGAGKWMGPVSLQKFQVLF